MSPQKPPSGTESPFSPVSPVSSSENESKEPSQPRAKELTVKISVKAEATATEGTEDKKHISKREWKQKRQAKGQEKKSRRRGGKPLSEIQSEMDASGGGVRKGDEKAPAASGEETLPAKENARTAAQATSSPVLPAEESGRMVLAAASEKTEEKHADKDVTTSPVEAASKKEKAAEAVMPVEAAKVLTLDHTMEMPDMALEAVRARVEAARRAYVYEDYVNTNRWLKIKNFFRGIKQEKSADTEYYQAEYNNALIDLRNAELANIKQSGLEGKALHEALAGTLKYFKKDEPFNVRRERDQVRMEQQGWPGIVMEQVENIGRSYNSLSFKQKTMTAGVLLGLAGMTGGTSLLARRLLAGAGAAVALEAVAGKIADARQSAKAEKEAREQMELLEKHNFWNEKRSHEADVRYLNEMIAKDIFSLDKKLQKSKHDALLRKAAAFGLGFGGGYFAKELFDLAGGNWLAREAKEVVMEKWGGNEVAEAVKEYATEKLPAQSIPPAATIAIPEPEPPRSSDVLPSEPREAVVPDETAPAGPITPEPESVLPPTDVPTEPAEPKGTLVPDEEAAAVPAATGLEGTAAKFQDILNGPYDVKKGDSVWKIIAARVEGLEGSEKTHFVDALKDKVGDIRLKAGAQIDFSQYFNQADIAQAYAEAQGLSPEKIASIAANDAKIAAFAAAHPDVTLTHESVDSILHADQPAALGVTDIPEPEPKIQTDIPQATDSQVAESAPDAPDANSSASTEDWGKNDLRLETEYDLKGYTQYFKDNPEKFPLFKKSGTEYLAFISQENPEVMNRLGMTTFRELGLTAYSNRLLENRGETVLGEFVALAEKTYGKLGSPQPKEKVYEYVMRLAMIGLEHPTKKRILLPLAI